ncbi:hypothetical protein GCM10011583_54920 [Streptomyces camponoticapitis]|uniref:Uncharacterized protein n=1 Tax=Streptomyces camponoticapitis TaxID=1616125 RepID=A0ABQ2EQG4_9ACTN|nr:hypothetical protein GCM10011583_54920 [Streptomyces camponoticapitis]
MRSPPGTEIGLALSIGLRSREFTNLTPPVPSLPGNNSAYASNGCRVCGERAVVRVRCIRYVPASGRYCRGRTLPRAEPVAGGFVREQTGHGSPRFRLAGSVARIAGTCHRSASAASDRVTPVTRQARLIPPA